MVTPAGDILLDGGFVETAPMISYTAKGLAFSHGRTASPAVTSTWTMRGIPELAARDGPKFVAIEQEVPGLTAGTSYPAAKPDRVIHDGDTVSVGAAIMTAHLTPGHTRGCTTWFTTVKDGAPKLSRRVCG